MNSEKMESRHRRAREKAAAVRIAVFDVDGVMTDGGLYFTSAGDELKRFNVQDGLGLKWLMQSGIEVAIITGRTSELVKRRARDLGIEALIQGREDKCAALRELIASRGLTAEQVAYLGDDLPDLSAIRFAGVGGAVANATELVKVHADWIARSCGGDGAVREFCEFLLEAQDRLVALQNRYLDA